MRKSLMAWLVGLLVALGATPAAALTTGMCYPADAARAALAEQGMQPLIVGNRTGYGYSTAMIFFGNADLSRGYLIRGDKPLGEMATEICVDSVYRDIHLNDVARPGIPAWALMPGVDAKAAMAICRRDGLGYQKRCSDHDGAIKGQAQNNQRVMMIAIGTAMNPIDRSIRQDQRIVLTLQPDRQIGLVEATTPEGANYILSAYAKGAFTQFGSKALDGGN